MVITNSSNRYPICYECEKADLKGTVKDPKMKKLLNIPEEFYKENSFLRSIKINCIKYGKLTEKQVEYFKKAVDKMKEDKKNA